MEILAPVGDFNSLNAALEAGADAVYLGLTTLNARRGARNFQPSELAEVVNQVHQYNAKVNLTLNIDLSDREIGQAFRIVQLAADVGVDVIIIRDPALFFLTKIYPEIEFHFSTQVACCNWLDAKFAEKIGIKRVVLARENSFAEVEEISEKSSVETEVFAQGAMCFCVSGKCLLSSWGGGRSGNRGACTSPCRVPWSHNNHDSSGSIFSMKDLGAISFVKQLQEIGVDSLKIEGRLKSPEWISFAVKSYKKALAGDVSEELLDDVDKLGEYTGRELTDRFLAGETSQLTGTSGRTSNNTLPKLTLPTAIDQNTLYVDLSVSGPKIVLKMNYKGKVHAVELTKSKPSKRAVQVSLIWSQLSKDFEMKYEFCCDDDSFLVPKRFGNLLKDEVNRFVRLTDKVEKKVEVKLLSETQALLGTVQPANENCNSLGSLAGIVRMKAKNYQPLNGKKVVLEDISVESLEKVLDDQIIALPEIFYNPDEIIALVEHFKGRVKTWEANSLGAIYLLQSLNLKFTAGPGLAVLNHSAARFLADQGCLSVYASIEADKEKLEDLTQKSGVPVNVTVFSYPELMTSRVSFPESLIGKTVKDRRSIELKLDKRDKLTTLHSVKPFSLIGMKNENITAANYVLDLTETPDLMQDLLRIDSNNVSNADNFNYDRKLY